MAGWMHADRHMNRQPRWLVADVALTGLFVWITVVSLRSDAYVDQFGPIEGAGWLLALSPTFLLPGRRFAPATTLTAATALYFLISTTQGDSNAPLAAPFFVYAVGITRPVVVSGPFVGGCAALLSIGTLIGTGDPDPLTAIVWFLLLGSGWLLAISIRRNQTRTEQLTLDVADLEGQHAEVARAARVDERARIARELHDAVGHAVNVMVLQAGAARLAGDPDQAHDTLAEIEHVGRSALVDLDHLLGLLDETDDGAARTPSRTVDDIVALVQDLRAAGAEINLDDQCGCDLDWRTAAAAYRIAQEALTNAIKHAGGAHIDLTMSCSSRDFRLVVADDGLGAGASRSSHGGRGIPGMTERASVLGGRLDRRAAIRRRLHRRSHPAQNAGRIRCTAPATLGSGRPVTISVLIVDDDTLVRAGVRMMIETQDDLSVAGEADNGDDAVRLAGELDPDVVLMDIRMPGVDGLEATRRLTSAATTDDQPDRPRVLVLTTFELDDYVFEAVRAGASGFLLKRTPPEDLLDGIRTVAHGDSLLSPSVTRRLMSEFARATRDRPVSTDVTNRDLEWLTEREREVLILVAHGLANREIANELHVGESTVKTHVKHILAKLNLRDRIHAVVFAYETGLIAVGDA